MVKITRIFQKKCWHEINEIRQSNNTFRNANITNCRNTKGIAVYGAELWTINENDVFRIQALEMSHQMNGIRNKEITRNLRTYSGILEIVK